jgi:hypothetical protein
MTLPVYPNSISLSAIGTEFSVPGTPVSLSQLYRNGTYVKSFIKGSPHGASTFVPTSGALSLDSFHGASKYFSQTFTSSQSWTVPAGVTSVEVLTVGGGGSGGSIGTLEGGGGGGAGGYVHTTLSVTPGAVIPIVVGAGGAASGLNVQGADGVSSSFNSTAIAYGGGGGGGDVATVVSGGGLGGGGGGGSGGCPAPWEMILLANQSWVRADMLQAGQYVWTRHETTGVWGSFEVEAVTPDVNDRWVLTMENGRTLTASFNHPMFMVDGTQVQLSLLKPSDMLIGPSVPNAVVSVSKYNRGEVIKITVKDAHTYVNNGLLSHNLKKEPDTVN